MRPAKPYALNPEHTSLEQIQGSRHPTVHIPMAQTLATNYFHMLLGGRVLGVSGAGLS